MSGEMFFDKEGMEEQTPDQPISIGEILQEELSWKLREVASGRIKIFSLPEPGEQYVIAGDAAEGIIGRDTASALVLNKRLNTTAAVAKGPYTPEELAQILISLGNFFNRGMIAPENKGYGYMVCQIVYSKYGNLYRRMITKKGAKEQTEILGFNTNPVTRPQMLAQMNEEIKNKSTGLISEELIDECGVFIVDPDTNKPQAQTGYQDGLVICRAIAGMVRQQYPYIKKETNKKSRDFKSISSI
jgi:hypothetical protein